MYRFIIVFLFAAGCVLNDKDTGSKDTGPFDVDGDGFSIGDGDCDDNNATINPDGVEGEQCDGRDNDCDGTVDEEILIGYADLDADGFGDPNNPTGCDAGGVKHVENSNDCDDNNASVNPAASEVCNGIDDDCDGVVDNITTGGDGNVYYYDRDGDGYGVGGDSEIRCGPATGYSTTFDDCDDANSTINPSALEVCDGVDNDCDNDVDEDTLITWYADTDGDIYGDAGSTVLACTLPDGYSIVDGDCDDANEYINPSALEVCDSVDNNCDGTVDEDAFGAPTWYFDADRDGYGDAGNTRVDCDPAGYIANSTDCDDSNVAVNPAASEVCNSTDDDCDGNVDEDAIDAPTWYADTDGDLYGDVGNTTLSCDQPDGYLADSSDCDDTEFNTNPDSIEICNGADDDCDGTVDNNAINMITWYADTDGDSYGDVGNTALSCDQPSGYLLDSSDCDDADEFTNPSGIEICNGLDDNCDGTVDEDSAVDAPTWYADGDIDGYGDAGNTAAACAAPVGYSEHTGDCDDSNDTVYPGATEICNGLDNDCDGNVGAADADSDGFAACDECNDADSSIHPSAMEVCDGQDNNCDGETDEDTAFNATTWHVDADLDGFGNGMPLRACNAPDGYVAIGGDCDDSDATVYPGAIELCNGVDDDCDVPVEIDEGAVDFTTWYRDTDHDGYGDVGNAIFACTPPMEYIADSSDCDDSDVSINPGADEFCNNLDDDCDGNIDSDAVDAQTWYADNDGDNYGDAGNTTLSCDAPSGYGSDSSDCDDEDEYINPDVSEICDGVDNNCDGTVDTDAIDMVTWYRDADDDGYGDASMTWATCLVPANYVDDNSSDCDDSNVGINPGAAETPYDSIDQDCDGADLDDLDEDGYELAEDCNDFNAAESPSEGEQCNGLDDDCDGNIDEDWVVGDLCTYDDNDGDGYGASNEDCDDLNVSVNPGAIELCNDDVDNDCSGIADGLDGIEVCY